MTVPLYSYYRHTLHLLTPKLPISQTDISLAYLPPPQCLQHHPPTALNKIFLRAYCLLNRQFFCYFYLFFRIFDIGRLVKI